MSRRAVFCHLCDITSPGEITGYVNGRPQYSSPSTVHDVPCRFYNLTGTPTNTDSGPHVIEITKVRFTLDIHISEGCTIKGLSFGFDRNYTINGLPSVVYSQKKPLFLECTLKSVDGEV
ncbi:MAG TPA: hypothetical protein VN372_14130 [Methanospirillum sp.]|nr:hypothetical protein [Methanospirillum sp.]